MAIEKGDPEWDAKVRQVFAELKADGTLACRRNGLAPISANEHLPSSPSPWSSHGCRPVGFRTRLLLTWLALFGLFVAFSSVSILKFSIILEKFPNLAGFKLGPNGFRKARH